MSREVRIAVPPEETDELLAEIQQIEGLISLQAQRGASIKPRGDVIRAEMTNQSLHPLMVMLDEREIGRDESSSITTNQPKAIVSPTTRNAIWTDASETTWEETETAIGRESNMTVNALLVMAIAGVLAAIGLTTGTLHIVIAAMVIAPGFEPITRIGLGIAGGSSAWKRGLINMALGYGTLVLGAIATTAVLFALGNAPLSGGGTYHLGRELISYWTSITAPSLLVSGVASIAGAVLIASDRIVLTSGVMIALALIPAAALIGVATVAGRWSMAGQAALRWGIDVGFITVFSLLVFTWKRVHLHKRKMMI